VFINKNEILTHQLNGLQQEHPYCIRELGLKLETIADFGIGYYEGRCKMYQGQVVIPIRNLENRLVAYAKHRPGTMECGLPQYELTIGFRKKLEVFNLGGVVKEVTAKPLLIVQDIFDALHLRQNGHRNVVALMGDNMSPIQEKLIHNSTYSQSCILVMFRQCHGGAVKAKQIAIQLSKCCYVKVFHFKKPSLGPRDLTPQEVENLS
jgi:hypothetical protein